MPVVNIGLQRTRDRVIGSGGMNTAVDSIGVGTNDAVEGAGDTRLGAGTAPKNFSSWKSGASLTTTTGGDATADPWWQFEATYATTEANQTLFEIGTSAGTLTGDNPAGNDGTRLYSRKRIGGATGVGKTADIELVARVRVTY